MRQLQGEKYHAIEKHIMIQIEKEDSEESLVTFSVVLSTQELYEWYTRLFSREYFQALGLDMYTTMASIPEQSGGGHNDYYEEKDYPSIIICFPV